MRSNIRRVGIGKRLASSSAALSVCSPDRWAESSESYRIGDGVDEGVGERTADGVE